MFLSVQMDLMKVRGVGVDVTIFQYLRWLKLQVYVHIHTVYIYRVAILCIHIYIYEYTLLDEMVFSASIQSMQIVIIILKYEKSLKWDYSCEKKS